MYKCTCCTIYAVCVSPSLMSSEIEMNDLSQPKGAPTELGNEEILDLDLDDAARRDYTISIWAWTSATLFVTPNSCKTVIDNIIFQQALPSRPMFDPVPSITALCLRDSQQHRQADCTHTVGIFPCTSIRYLAECSIHGINIQRLYSWGTLFCIRWC